MSTPQKTRNRNLIDLSLTRTLSLKLVGHSLELKYLALAYLSNYDRKNRVVRMRCSARNTPKPELLSMAMMETRDSAHSDTGINPRTGFWRGGYGVYRLYSHVVVYMLKEKKFCELFKDSNW